MYVHMSPPIYGDLSLLFFFLCVVNLFFYSAQRDEATNVESRVCLFSHLQDFNSLGRHLRQYCCCSCLLASLFTWGRILQNVSKKTVERLGSKKELWWVMAVMTITIADIHAYIEE
jgi:hypothetical protein